MGPELGSFRAWSLCGLFRGLFWPKGCESLVILRLLNLYIVALSWAIFLAMVIIWAKKGPEKKKENPGP